MGKVRSSARLVWHAGGWVPRFVRGARFGHSLDAPVSEGSREPGRLEQYFDSYSEGPGIWKWRHYLDIYQRHLSSLRGRPVHVLAVGVFSGGSLQMWRDYFGTDSQIYGVDILEECRAHEREGIRIFIGDQGDPSFWEAFFTHVPKLDVVIDDGGHKPAQQMATFEAVLPRLQPGGIYLCEDLQGPTNSFHAYVEGLSRSLQTYSHLGPSGLQSAVASIHLYPFLTVIERPQAPVTGFKEVRSGTLWENERLDP